MVFEVKNVEEVIDFRWNTFARSVWYFHFIYNIVYIIILTMYCFDVYITASRQGGDFNAYNIFLLVSCVWPITYTCWKIYKQSLRHFFSDMNNYSHILFIWAGVTNGYIQITHDSFKFECRLFTCLIFVQQIFLTISFFKIFPHFTYLTVMLGRLIRDLLGFFILYMLQIFLIGLILAVIGLGN